MPDGGAMVSEGEEASPQTRGPIRSLARCLFEAPPMSLALPTFAIFPEERGEGRGRRGERPQLVGYTPQEGMAPPMRPRLRHVSGSVTLQLAMCGTPPDAAVVHDGRQDPCLALKLGLRHACHGLRHTCTMRDGAGQHDLLCLGSMS